MKERNYNELDALKAAQILFPKSIKAEKLTRGYSHDIYEVITNSNPEKIIIRFSNNNPRQNSLAKEIRTIKILKEINIPVPEVLLHDYSKKIVPYEFVIMSKIEG